MRINKGCSVSAHEQGGLRKLEGQRERRTRMIDLLTALCASSALLLRRPSLVTSSLLPLSFPPPPPLLSSRPHPSADGHMDVRKLEFQSDRFDLVFDKGTLDSILCGDDAEVSAAKAISEIARVLVPGGVFIMVSHASADHREALFKIPGDNFIHFQYATVAKPRVDDAAAAAISEKEDEVHFVYVAIKGGKK